MCANKSLQVFRNVFYSGKKMTMPTFTAWTVSVFRYTLGAITVRWRSLIFAFQTSAFAEGMSISGVNLTPLKIGNSDKSRDAVGNPNRLPSPREERRNERRKRFSSYIGVCTCARSSRTISVDVNRSKAFCFQQRSSKDHIGSVVNALVEVREGLLPLRIAMMMRALFVIS